MGRPKFRRSPGQEQVRIAAAPENYLKQSPVWRFSDFDWEGPYGSTACLSSKDNIVKHISEHLSNFETMTWAEIERASGGRRNGNNSHPISVDKFKREVQDRLKLKGIVADTLFSLRLDAGTRVYGIRETNVLRIVFFDPYHKDRSTCAYQFSD